MSKVSLLAGIHGNDIDDRVKAEGHGRQRKSGIREAIDRDSMFEDIVGSSNRCAKYLRQVTKLRVLIRQFLILARPVRGKELIARAIHNDPHGRSGRSSRVNARHPTIAIASKLFGHEKGPFTAARKCAWAVSKPQMAGLFF